MDPFTGKVLVVKLERCEHLFEKYRQPKQKPTKKGKARKARGRSKKAMVPEVVPEKEPECTSDQVCWGCLEEGDLMDMHIVHTNNGHDEIIADMISYCFAIKVSSGNSATRKYYMCTTCISRLRDAVKFRRQLEVAQSFFNKLFISDSKTNESPIKHQQTQITQWNNAVDRLDSEYQMVNDEVLKKKAEIMMREASLKQLRELNNLQMFKRSQIPPMIPVQGQSVAGKPIYFMNPTIPINYPICQTSEAYPVAQLASLSRNVDSNRPQPVSLTSVNQCNKSILLQAMSSTLNASWSQENDDDDVIIIDDEKDDDVEEMMDTSDSLLRPVAYIEQGRINMYPDDDNDREFITADDSGERMRSMNYKAVGQTSLPMEYCGPDDTQELQGNESYGEKDIAVQLWKNPLDFIPFTTGFLCPICKESFEMILERRAHITSKHPETAALHMCEECGKTMSTKAHLNCHVRNVHLKLKKYVCEICNQMFYRKLELSKHMYSKHNDRSIEDSMEFSCSNCHMRFWQKSSYTRHLKVTPGCSTNGQAMQRMPNGDECIVPN